MRFYAVETQSGLVLDELPLLPNRELTRVLQGYGTGGFSLSTTDHRCPPEWEQRTLKHRNSVVMVDDSPQENIVWAGMITNRKRSYTPVVELTCATFEYYLLRRYVPDMKFSQVDQALILQTLAQLAGGADGLNMDYDTPLTGVLRDRTYANDENARVYQRAQELSNVIGGATWMIDTQWADPDHTRVRKIFRTGTPMLGDQDRSPNTVFDLPGPITQSIDYEERGGENEEATHVLAIGDGEGESKLYSSPVIDTQREGMGWPRLEERQSFSGVTETATINSHARSEADSLFGGQQVLTFDSRMSEGPDVWEMSLGQTVRAIIDLPHLPIDDVFHLIGYSADYRTRIWKPTLAKIGA